MFFIWIFQQGSALQLDKVLLFKGKIRTVGMTISPVTPGIPGRSFIQYLGGNLLCLSGLVFLLTEHLLESSGSLRGLELPLGLLTPTCTQGMSYGMTSFTLDVSRDIALRDKMASLPASVTWSGLLLMTP